MCVLGAVEIRRSSSALSRGRHSQPHGVGHSPQHHLRLAVYVRAVGRAADPAEETPDPAVESDPHGRHEDQDARIAHLSRGEVLALSG